MRQPNNQNKRLRNRNRKGPNPLTKSFESNGPDGKIRGTALSIAEKYIQASRDASASGDRIKAENLLQHAEHYNRIVAAAQSHLPAQQSQPRDQSDADEGDDNTQTATNAPSHSVADPDTPQPTVDHSSQFANGVANGKIPNGVKIDGETGTESISTPEKKAEASTPDADEAAEAPAPRRRPRGRPRTSTRRPPLQPSEIVAEVSKVETEKPAKEAVTPDSSES